MNFLKDYDWEKYNKLVYDSISFEYFPKNELEIKSENYFELLELEEEKIIYIPIGKNASTSISNSLNFTPLRLPIPPRCIDLRCLDIPEKYKTEYKFFTTIREPKKRWISGINEFLYSPFHEGIDFEEGRHDKFLTELTNNKFIFDFHTIPQLSWLSFCFKNNLDIILLNLDERLSEKISNVLQRSVTINHDNKMQDYDCKIETYNFCRDIFTRYCVENENFLKLYEMDLYLYNNSV